MKRPLLLCWLLLFAPGFLGGVLRSDPLDLVHQGNEAFARGEFLAAVDLYGRAADGITDPGLVAFNKATALYHLGRYREAELHYERCHEDAQGTRRAQLLYNWGNAIVQQAAMSDGSRLKEAMVLYEKCLQQEEADPSLLADARYNLELARLLWIQARTRNDKAEHDNPDRPGHEGASQGAKNDSNRAGGLTDSASPDPSGKPGPAPNNRGTNGSARAETAYAPGKGNLPPLPDEENLATMSAEDALAYLKQAMARIEQERKAYQQRVAPAPATNWMDW